MTANRPAEDVRRGEDAWARGVAAMMTGAVRRHLRPGDRLFAEGDPSTDVFLVLEGLVKIVKATPDGVQSIVALRGPGGLIGEHSAIDGRPRGSDAVAATDVVVDRVGGHALTDVVERDGRFARELLAQFTAQLRATTQLASALSTGDAAGLVARRLCQLVADPMFASFRSTTSEGVTVEMPLTQEELASWSGVSHRSAAGALRHMRDAGVLTTRRLGLHVHDVVRLAALAGRPLDLEGLGRSGDLGHM